MINQATQTNLVKIYFFICQKFNDELQYQCQRFTNNDTPDFTDQEILTIYLFCVHFEQRFKIKDIHTFIKNYYSDWFPLLPSYTTFNTRLNRLSYVFQLLTELLMKDFMPQEYSENTSLIDSMPIITCSGKRQGKVAKGITDKSFCSTKNLYYYGVKLHATGFQVKGHLPHPESIIVTKASENDLNAYKHYLSPIENRSFYGDKIYAHKEYFDNLYTQNKTEMLTPIKAIKGQPEALKLWDSAYNFQYSKAVSAIRQPIESFFNWLIEKTDIQRASKVRSKEGLQIHIFGKLAAAFLTYVF